MSSKSSLNCSVVSLLDYPCEILSEMQPLDVTDKNQSSSFHTSLDGGAQASSSSILGVGNSRLDSNFVINPLNVDDFHSLAIPPCNIEVFDGGILNWPTFRDLFSGVFY